MKLFSHRLIKSFCTTSKNKINRTALYDYHVNVLKGKMVPFAGYEMPVNYPDGVLKEHLHCRDSAGLFDVSHMGQIKIHGKDRVEFIETIVVGNIAQLKDNHSTLSLILNDKAGIIDDTIVSKFPDHIHMVVNAGNKHKDLQHMNKIKEERFAKSDIKIEYIENSALIALQGPKAAESLQKLVDVDLKKYGFMTHHELFFPTLNEKLLVSRSGYTGEDGFEIAVPASKAVQFAEILLKDSAIKPCGLGARDSLRLEAGLCLHGNDIDETRTPAEGTLMWTVRANPSIKYIGYDVLQQQIKEGIKEKRVGFKVLDSGILRHGNEIKNKNGDKVGVVTSGTFSPNLKYAIGMAYVQTSVSKIGTELQGHVRSKVNSIKIAKMPFVPSRYYKI